MMLTVDLTPELERRLRECAKARGVSGPDLLRELIAEGLDDLEDVRIAEERLRTPRPALSGLEARRALGLDG
jgi:predicted DNA-binding protein